MFVLVEIQNDHSCLTCAFSKAINEDEYGNPEYVTCLKKEKDMAIDEICEDFKY